MSEALRFLFRGRSHAAVQVHQTPSLYHTIDSEYLMLLTLLSMFGSYFDLPVAISSHSSPTDSTYFRIPAHSSSR